MTADSAALNSYKGGCCVMTSFRFIHTADIHLDNPLKGLAGYDGPPRESEHPGLRPLRQSRCGKPDYPALDHAEGVNVFSARKPETFMLKELDVALHGQSFRQRDVTDNLAAAYPEPVDGVFNIGVLHTGMGGHANYAPCTVDDLVTKGYDYWALGHVHHGAVLHENPHVVFPGNLQGRHIRETGPKGAYLVSVEDREIVESGPLHIVLLQPFSRTRNALDPSIRPAESVWSPTTRRGMTAGPDPDPCVKKMDFGRY